MTQVHSNKREQGDILIVPLRFTTKKHLSRALGHKEVVMSLSAKLVVLFSALFFIAGCSSNESVKVREETWKAKVEQFQPVGKTRGELFEWQKINDVPLSSFPNEGGTILETIEGDGLVCSRWHIFLSTKLDSSGKIESYTVTSAGSCL